LTFSFDMRTVAGLGGPGLCHWFCL